MSNFNEHAATWAQDTQAVRGGLDRSNFQETSEALFLNSGFVYESAEAAEQAFTGEVDRFVYSRYGNPSVATFQERLRLLEGKEACFATASGMSAVFTALGALLAAGDRVVASRSLFGSCFVILNELLPRWGVETVFVDGPDLEQWREALSVPTTAVFFESPSNPMQEIIDMDTVFDVIPDTSSFEIQALDIWHPASAGEDRIDGQCVFVIVTDQIGKFLTVFHAHSNDLRIQAHGNAVTRKCVRQYLRCITLLTR